MKCPNCSNEVPETANVCGYCGQRLNVAAPQKFVQTSAVELLRKSVNKTWFWLAAGAVILSAILASTRLSYLNVFLWDLMKNVIGHDTFNSIYELLIIPVLILLGFATISYWKHQRRAFVCFLGLIAVGLLFISVYFYSPLYYYYIIDAEFVIRLKNPLIFSLWVCAVWAAIDALRNR